MIQILQKFLIVSLVILFGLPIGAGANNQTKSNLKGRILLQVESCGEAWYINPGDEYRYYLGRPQDAFSLMRQLGIGISSVDLEKIQPAANNMDGADIDGDGLSDMFEDAIGSDKAKADSDGDGYNDSDELKRGYNVKGLGIFQSNQVFVQEHKGKIFLAVEKKGEAWYVNPVDGLRYFLGRPSDAFALMRGLGLGISNQDLDIILTKPAGGNLAAVKAKVKKFVESQLTNPSSEISIEEIVEENGMYRVTITLANGQIMNSYVDKELTKFFPQAMDLNEEKQASEPSNAQASNNEIQFKTKVPVVDLFVMSYCPYGTQIEKAIIPVADLLKDKIEFSLKFVNYAMHGEKEINEQMSQYCIQKEEPEKFLSYLSCFLEDGDSSGCISKIGVDQSNLDNCVSVIEDEYGIKSSFADKTTWKSGRFPLFSIYDEECSKYGVSGSPTFVLNGNKVSVARSQSAILEKICSAFIDSPAECEAGMSISSEAPGFGYSKNGTDTQATCD